MVSKVKAILGERNGAELEAEEIAVTSDYLASKGIAFEGLDTYLMEKVGRVLKTTEPDSSQKVTYLANGDVDFLEFFITSIQITSNRISKCAIDYVGDNASGEIWNVFDNDGTTILKTITRVYSYIGDDIQSSTEVET